MESITIKVPDRMAREIEIFIKPNYGTKTEFIREAIRNKIKEARKEKALNELKKYFGKAKTKTSYKEERKIREDVGKKLAKRFGIKLD